MTSAECALLSFLRKNLFPGFQVWLEYLVEVIGVAWIDNSCMIHSTDYIQYDTICSMAIWDIIRN